jgi:hypothetical protein
MPSSGKNYLIMIEVLRKMNMDENYRPTDYEQKVVADFLKEDKPSHRRSKKETRNIQQIVHDRICR